MRTNTICPLCGLSMQRCYKGMFDDRYGMPELYDILMCSACELAQTSPSLCEEDLPAVYGTYYPRKNLDIGALPGHLEDPISPIGRFKIWMKGIGNQGHYFARAGMTVLDYGCGTGTSLLELRAMGADGYGIEVDPNVKEIAERLDLKIQIGSFAEVPWPGIKFDLISLNQVIEHIPDPKRLLRMLKPCLKEGGVVVLSFPNLASLYRRLCGRSWINWHVPYHIHHFSRNAFSRLCKQEGWSVVAWKTVTPNLWTLMQLRALTSRPERGKPSPLWIPQDATPSDSAFIRKTPRARWTRLLLALHNRLWAGTRRAGRTFGHVGVLVVNRIIDFLGSGDSLLVIVRPDRSTHRE